MSDLESKGYETLREFVSSADGWNYLGLVTDDGVIEAVIDVADDSRASWTDPASNPIVLEVDVAGGNSDIDTPVELAGTALYDSADDVGEGDDLSATDPVHEDNFDEANVIIDGDDKLEIDHTVELPEEDD